METKLKQEPVAEDVAAEGMLDGRFSFIVRKTMPPATIHVGTEAAAYLMLKYPSERRPVEPVAAGSVQVVPVTWQDAVAGLERIFGELQTEFHDQWDWIDAYFYVEVLKAQIQSEPVADGGGLPPGELQIIRNCIESGKEDGDIATIHVDRLGDLLAAYASSREALTAALGTLAEMPRLIFESNKALRERMQQAVAELEPCVSHYLNQPVRTGITKAISLLSPEGSSR